MLRFNKKSIRPIEPDGQDCIRSQSGIALIIVLLLLLAITMVGVTALRINLSDENSASNFYLREQARIASEIALEYAESEISLNPQLYYQPFFDADGKFDNDFGNDNSGDGCARGLCLPVNFTAEGGASKQGGQWVRSQDFDVWRNSAKHRTVPRASLDQLGIGSDVEAPKYIIEFLGHIPRSRPEGGLFNSMCDVDGDGFSGAGEGRWTLFPYCRLDPLLFRITALGTAGKLAHRAEVMLQSTFIADTPR